MPLVTTKEMFRKAYEGGYAIGAFNVNNMEIVQGITEAAQLEQAPVILQVSAGARKYAKHIYLTKLVEAAVADTDVPIALHLDHGDGFEICKDCIDGGFTSVMIDGSKLSFEENIAVTRKVVEYAHDHGVMVEGELGKLAGIEDAVNVSEADAQFTNPAEVEEFVSRTGVDSLAIAIGTSHGAYKFKPGQKPQLRFDILQQVSDRLPGFPIVLHGASSVIQADVETVNRFGGKMPDAIGIPEEMLRHAAEMAVCKINIDSDLRLAFTGEIRKHLAEHPDHFDPRQYLTQTREILRDEHGVCAVQTEEVRWDKGPDGRMTLQVQPGTSKRWPADLVLIAMGFTGPEETLIQAYGLTQEARGRVVADNFMTVRRGVFAAGDMHIGQSLVVRAINEGQHAASACHAYLSAL